ncbi:MAG: Lysozyme like domain [Bacteroidota bacterium]|jgi:hypothetical protein
MNRNKRNKIVSYIIGFYALFCFGAKVVLAEPMSSTIPLTTEQIGLTGFRLERQAASMPVHVVKWQHGDISWLPELASAAGWPKRTWKRLGQIILRESGGCPNRTGGTIVDKDCNIVGHTGATNTSDSGLLQINGVNWDPKRSGRQLLCADYKICTQEQLLDPLTNLKAGYILFQKAGWDPWDPCAWGPEYAAKCRATS